MILTRAEATLGLILNSPYKLVKEKKFVQPLGSNDHNTIIVHVHMSEKCSECAAQ